MRVQVVLTGPPRVLLGRSVVEVVLPGDWCTLEDLVHALVQAEPRIARYLRGDDGRLAPSLRPLRHDRLLEPEEPIPHAATITLLYAIAGGQQGDCRGPSRGESLSRGMRRAESLRTAAEGKPERAACRIV